MCVCMFVCMYMFVCARILANHHIGTPQRLYTPHAGVQPRALHTKQFLVGLPTVRCRVIDFEIHSQCSSVLKEIFLCRHMLDIHQNNLRHVTLAFLSPESRSTVDMANGQTEWLSKHVNQRFVQVLWDPIPSFRNTFVYTCARLHTAFKYI